MDLRRQCESAWCKMNGALLILFWTIPCHGNVMLVQWRHAPVPTDDMTLLSNYVIQVQHWKINARKTIEYKVTRLEHLKFQYWSISVHVVVSGFTGASHVTLYTHHLLTLLRQTTTNSLKLWVLWEQVFDEKKTRSPFQLFLSLACCCMQAMRGVWCVVMASDERLSFTRHMSHYKRCVYQHYQPTSALYVIPFMYHQNISKVKLEYR